MKFSSKKKRVPLPSSLLSPIRRNEGKTSNFGRKAQKRRRKERRREEDDLAQKNVGARAVVGGERGRLYVGWTGQKNPHKMKCQV